MKFKFKRNQVIITALVAMIAVAGYLNWQDSREEPEFAQAIALDDNGYITQLDQQGLEYIYYDDYDDIFVDYMPWISSEFDFDWDFDVMFDADGNGQWDNIFADNQENQQQHELGEAVFVSASEQPSFFVQARIEREQSRARQTDILMNMINEQNVDTEQRAIITDAMLEIQGRIEKETSAEAMLETRGFENVYVRMTDQYVDVVVDKEVLSDSELAQIEDVVTRKTGMTVSQIRVSPMRK